MCIGVCIYIGRQDELTGLTSSPKNIYIQPLLQPLSINSAILPSYMVSALPLSPSTQEARAYGGPNNHLREIVLVFETAAIVLYKSLKQINVFLPTPNNAQWAYLWEMYEEHGM